MMTRVPISIPSIIKHLEDVDYQSPMDVLIYRPKYRHIGDNIGLMCHGFQHPKISTPSTLTNRDIKVIYIAITK
jgi:hypothetical protein